ncbi:DUF1453 domain-containing protein [Streptomyces sp. NPDC007084]|uniref:DUF1453 domain-containing protein n=1 Tax=Streptomyces sp. NPDC007084 TaxID=3154313 RepID=UPI0034535C32
MSGLMNAAAICAVAALVIARQFRAGRVGTDRRWWVVPAVLAFMAVREPGLIDPHHQVEASVLLAAELVIGLAVGAGWAWTTRMWTESDGAVWSKGTKASGAVWIGGICLRGGLFGVGALLGVHQDSSGLMLGLAATLLVRAGIVRWRAQSSQRAAYGQTSAYGDGVVPALRKEGV